MMMKSKSKKIFYLTICSLLFMFANFGFATAQEVKQYYYQGTVANRAVRFYLKQLPNNCGGDDTYVAMYQYGKGKNWIELLIQNNQKGNFCFTEIRFTGVLILKKSNNGLNGIWISPDGKQQLKVKLTQQKISTKEIAEIEDRLEVTHYENFDC